MSDKSDEITGQKFKEKKRTSLKEFSLGIDFIDGLLKDEDVSDILINGIEEIYIEKKGKLIKIEDKVLSIEELNEITEKILSPLGKVVSEKSPICDARLEDGSRVNIIVPPIAIKGPNISIRKFSSYPFTKERLINLGTLTDKLYKFLKFAVQHRMNVVVSGGTATGKTTLLNFLANFIKGSERIVTIEDAAELSLYKSHVVPLESRPKDLEGKSEVSIRDLVINALRMRPDRIIVGECRGAETVDMLQAMNTGHDGSMTTIHSNSPRDTLSRLETMFGMSGIETTLRAIRTQIANAINLIIHMARFADGTRKIIKVTEISGMEGDVISTSDIFVFKQKGIDEEGRVLGEITSTGIVPSFCDQIKRSGLEVDLSLFKE